MSYFTGKTDWADGVQVTSTLLNAITINLRLSGDSVDASTITVVAGVLSVGVLGSANYGSGTITSTAFAAGAVDAAALATDAVETAKIKDLNVTGAKVAETTLGWSKTLTADRAVQADMQSETADHFVSPSVLKYHPGIPKAYGTVSIVSGTTTITGGYNVTGATDTGTGRQITLAVTMANTAYIVLVTYKDTGAVANSVAVDNDSATQFTLQAGAEAAGRGINFIVYGQLAVPP